MDEEETFNQSQSHINSFDEQEFLREILQPPEFSPETENPSPYPCSTIQNNPATSPSSSSLLSFDETSFDGNNDTMHISNSTNSIMSLDKKSPNSPLTTYLLSFDNSSVEPMIHEPSSKQDSVTKRTTREDDLEEPRVHQGTKRDRSSPKTQDHIMAERKRRRELTGCIIALSATIPGLKKMDKAYVLREAVNYIKQLQEHVKELENQNKNRRVVSVIHIRKSQASTNKCTTYCETNSDKSPLEVEARLSEKEVLIAIRCEKKKDIVLKIHALLGKLHLSISRSSVLSFGISTLIITIIAQMHDEYSMTMDDLVKRLRVDMLESHHMQL